MINKKGFTLIEVIVSLVLVSVVLTFMLSSLVKLRETYTKATENTDIIISSASISRVLNSDINKNGGIKYVICDNQGLECNIILNNEERRKIVIYSNQLTLEKECSNGEVMQCDVETKMRGRICYCPRKTIAKTLKYTAIVKENGIFKESLKYIKTLELIEDYDYQKKKTFTSGYTFGKMVINSYHFKSANKYLGSENIDNAYWNVMSSIDVEINDKINFADNTYGFSIYSSSSFPPGLKLGHLVTINLDYNENRIGGESTISSYLDKMYLKYGVGFYSRLDEDIIYQIEIPIDTSGVYEFRGFYYDDLKVIDEDGNILIPNIFFNNSTITLKAMWRVIK